MRIVLAVTGASGACYAEEFLRQAAGKAELDVVFSRHSATVLKHELGWEVVCRAAAPPPVEYGKREGSASRDDLTPQPPSPPAERGDPMVQVKGWPPELEKACRLWHPDDLTAPFASGSNAPEAMVIIPCSIGTAGRIAAGLGNDLITRAAAVCLKERRKLVLVVRETPLSLIDLENLTRLSRAGTVVMPAAPAFYGKPQDMEELVRQFVGRVMEEVGMEGGGGAWRVDEG